MVRIAVVGLGKMGISHLSIVNALPNVQVVAICDTAGYALDVLSKYTHLRGFTDFRKMLEEVDLDAVLIATPTLHHVEMVRKVLEKKKHVFCEKPFTLDWKASAELAQIAEVNGLVNQVGYHYRFVGTFQEARRIVESGSLGTISHVMAEAYGPVVLKARGSTWRSKNSEGGGCLHDYAAHPINLLNWYFGDVKSVSGAALTKIF